MTRRIPALRCGSFIVVLEVCLATLAFAATVEGAALRAGVAKVDITPPVGEPLYGYMDRTNPATGALDPLYARVLVLEAGGKRLALITLDLGRTFGPASLERLREAAAKTSGISGFLITASHTHAGPNILDEYPSGRVPAWESAAIEKIVRAIEEARGRLVEAGLGTGYGEVSIGYNRRRVNPDGSVTMLWRNPEMLPTSPVDPAVAVLRVDTTDGKPLAILVNYACHPVVFGPDNLEYSADFPGVMAKTVEQGFAGQPLCFFLQGGDGNINPFFATTPLAEDAVKKRDGTGERIGAEALRVAKEIETRAAPEPSLDVVEDTLTFRVRWSAEKFRSGLLEKYGQRVFEDHAEFLANVTRAELPMVVTTILINKQIAIMGLPGEPFVELQINFRDRCPAPDAFFVGYANGYFDYFPTLAAATEGGYGAGDSNTYVEPGAGERMVDHALKRVYEMLGRLSDLPEDLKKR